MNLRTQTLEKVVNITHELIVVCDPSGSVLSVNLAFCQKSGFKENEVLGKPMDFLKVPDGADWVGHAIDQVKNGERWHGMVQLKTKTEELLYLETSVSAVFDGKGNLIAYVGAGMDRTREQTITRHLHAMHRLESVGKLVGGIAHRFNNLLAAIMGHTEIMGMMAGDNPKISDRVQKILKATTQAKEFVSQMSSFSRKGELLKRATDIVPVMRNAVDFIRSATPRAVQIEAHLPDTLPPVMMVSDEINQMLLNLFTNAIRAVEGKDNPKIEIFLEETWKEFPAVVPHAEDRAVHCVKISIRDNGKGVDPRLQERIFEPFAIADDDGASSGMGLAIVQGIVLRHKGYIRLDSKVGAGSTFEIYLPIVEKKLTKDDEAPTGASTGTGRILLVDDEPLITSVGSELLGEVGYQVSAVNHPREALKLVEADPAGFDLIITDLTMPELTGIEMMQKIRELHSATPAILISGYNERIKPEQAKACGITQILSKPCPAATLMEAVRKTIGETSGGVR